MLTGMFHMSACRASRAMMSTSSSVARIAIVGSGPSGFYAAKYLLKDSPDIRVDIIDSLPNPYGA
jgi:ribulose 1,5-bisphosphate synthetase/thiazole synthase